MPTEPKLRRGWLKTWLPFALAGHEDKGRFLVLYSSKSIKASCKRNMPQYYLLVFKAGLLVIDHPKRFWQKPFFFALGFTSSVKKFTDWDDFSKWSIFTKSRLVWLDLVVTKIARPRGGIDRCAGLPPIHHLASGVYPRSPNPTSATKNLSTMAIHETKERFAEETPFVRPEVTALSDFHNLSGLVSMSSWGAYIPVSKVFTKGGNSNGKSLMDKEWFSLFPRCQT